MGDDTSTDALSMYQPLKEACCHVTFVAGANAWYVAPLSLRLSCLRQYTRRAARPPNFQPLNSCPTAVYVSVYVHVLAFALTCFPTWLCRNKVWPQT